MAATALRLHEPELDETPWIDAALRGDEQARALLAERTSPMVFRFAMRLLRNEQDACDATQETVVKVLRNLHRYDNRWRFTTWVLSIARNTCIDEFRRRRRRSYEEPPDVADPGPGPLELSDHTQRAQTLHQAMDKLPPMYREVLVLYHFEHLKYREIADMLDLPIGTVMNRIFRARQKLRTAYEEVEAMDHPLGAH